jgi:hypothetical protein
MFSVIPISAISTVTAGATVAGQCAASAARAAVATTRTSPRGVTTVTAGAAVTSEQSAVAARAPAMAAVKSENNSIATVTTDSEAPCTATITTTTHRVVTANDRIAAVASHAAIPTCVATAATVEPIATITYEPAGVATVAWRCARAGACGVGKTISTKDSGIRTLRRAIME